MEDVLHGAQPRVTDVMNEVLHAPYIGGKKKINRCILIKPQGWMG